MLNSKYIFTGGCLVITGLMGFPIWQEYLQGNLLFLFTILLTPYILYVRHPDTSSPQYALLGLLAALGHYVLGLNVLFLMSYLCLALFLVEWQWGKLNNLTLYWIFLLSPLTIFFFSVFSFPIRLELSNLAAYLLSFVQSDIVCQGNIITIQGDEFSVDHACMGLKMVGYSYLAFLVFITHFERKLSQQLDKKWIVLILSLGSIQILLANLIRIITIIIAGAMPETTAHEVIGLSSWIGYVIFPSYFFIQWLTKHYGQLPSPRRTKVLPPICAYSLLFALVISIGINSYNKQYQPAQAPVAAYKQNCIPNVEQQTNMDGILQLKNDEILIYIKPSCPPYRADHAPNICWKGSGYAFRKEAVLIVNDIPMLCAELHKGDAVLYTAWWYDNGLHQTNSQLEWRWNSLKGNGNYQLINITANNSATLKTYIQQFISCNQ